MDPDAAAMTAEVFWVAQLGEASNAEAPLRHCALETGERVNYSDSCNRCLIFPIF